MRLRPTRDVTISNVDGQMTDQEMRVRNEVQIAFSQTLDLPGKTPNERMIAWATQHAQKFAGIWENNGELRQKLLADWPTATRAAFMAAAVAGKFAPPITAMSGFRITSAART